MSPITSVVVISDHFAVERRLAELDLPRADILREAVLAGVTEAAACTEFDPPSAPGFELWRMGNRRLRELLVQEHDQEWRPDTVQGVPFSVNPEARRAVVLSSGSPATGVDDIDRAPSTKNRKGQVTENFVRINGAQGNLFAGRRGVLATPGSNERETWILLAYASTEEIRVEISLPAAIEAGHIVQWRERLILEPIPNDLDIGAAPIEDSPEIDFSVAPRALEDSRAS